jgi:hypothetical protein
MRASGIIRVGTCVAALFTLSQCASSGGGNDGTGGSSATGGSNGTGGSTGGSNGTGGTHTGGSNGTGGSNSTGGSNGTGGVLGTGGNGTGGSATGGAGGKGTGGSASGGSNGTGGMAGSGSGTGGTAGSGSGTGGMSGVDMGGMALAKPGDMTATTKQYLNLGDMRLINNRWGSDGLNCSSTQQSVFVNSDKTIGWKFNRGNCGDSGHANPDFPEVEFGVAPFGKSSSLLTSPAYSSTTLLPIQLSKLTSATVNIDSFNTTFTNPTYWDANFEFWISKNDPTTNADGGVYAEIITFVGWEANRQNSNSGGWSCTGSGTVPNTNFSLCHQSDSWGQGWRFFNFVNGSNSTNNFSQKVDIKAILDYVKSKYSGFTDSMYLTRIELGTEINDNTVGSASIKQLTFEINGQTRSIQTQ